jgi:hypothetical protein
VDATLTENLIRRMRRGRSIRSLDGGSSFSPRAPARNSNRARAATARGRCHIGCVVTLSIWPAAFAAIEATVSDGSEAKARTDGKGGYLVTLPRAMLDRLKSLRGPGESYSDVICAENRQPSSEDTPQGWSRRRTGWKRLSWAFGDEGAAESAFGGP